MSNKEDRRPPRARANLVFGSVLLVVAIVFLAVGFDRVSAFIFGFIGLLQVVVGALFHWSRRD